MVQWLAFGAWVDLGQLLAQQMFWQCGVGQMFQWHGVNRIFLSGSGQMKLLVVEQVVQLEGPWEVPPHWMSCSAFCGGSQLKVYMK